MTSRPDTVGGRRRERGGFTLTELLVVIGLIVLMLGMASAAFRSLTGSRSTEAAENLISAMLGRVRSEAIAQQQNRGVIFFHDLNSGRTQMAAVYVAVPAAGAVPAQIELVSDEDVQLLPPAVGVQSIVPPTVVGGNTAYNAVGVVMFDGNGMLSNMTYTIYTPGVLPPGCLYNVLNPLTTALFPYTYTFPLPGAPATTGFGLVAYDQDAYANQPDAASETTFLNSVADALLVNRYNGTLVKGQ